MVWYLFTQILRSIHKYFVNYKLILLLYKLLMYDWFPKEILKELSITFNKYLLYIVLRLKLIGDRVLPGGAPLSSEARG